MKWENKTGPLALLFGFVLLTGLPLIGAALPGGVPLANYVGGMQLLIENDQLRQVTGFLALGLIAFEILYALRKRMKNKKTTGSKKGMRAMHMLVGTALIPMIVIHTGGHLGSNLNGWLQASLIAIVLVGALGKLIEVIQRRRMAPISGPDASPEDIARIKQAAQKARLFHTGWLRVHVVLVGALMVLVTFHVFSVYYF